MQKYRVRGERVVMRAEPFDIEVEATNPDEAMRRVERESEDTMKIDTCTRVPNIERVRLLRDFLSVLPEDKFMMRNFFSDTVTSNPLDPGQAAVAHRCGTAACVGGWAMALFAPEESITQNGVSVVEARAADLLGLDHSTAHALFVPHPEGRHLSIFQYWEKLTTKDAVRALNGLLKDGKADWPTGAEVMDRTREAQLD